MCTVTYIPLKDRALFSSNRDENPSRRSAALPAFYKGKNNKMLYPADGAAGGTWIGLNDSGGVLILLNGGFVNHTKQPKYRISRGLIVKQLLDEKDILFAWEQLDLNNIEPFTVIAFLNNQLHQLVWTGYHRIEMKPDDSLPHIWSSATLYAPEFQTLRQEWFKEFLSKNPGATKEDLHKFLLRYNDDENGFIMNRNESVKTCSISLIEIDHQQAAFDYFDLLKGDSNKQVISLHGDTIASEKYSNQYRTVMPIAVHNNEISG